MDATNLRTHQLQNTTGHQPFGIYGCNKEIDT